MIRVPKMKTLLTKSFLAISILMVVGGITVDVLVWMKLIAEDEPPLVVHLSTFALIFSGYGNVITAVVNKEMNDG